MGYFSWLTSDTEESIRNNVEKDVYLLQPNGKLPIKETFYNGYGDFGGIDAYEWLVENNLSIELIQKINEINKDGKYLDSELRLAGVYLNGSFLLDTITSKEYSYNNFMAKIFDMNTFIDYESIIPEYNLSINQLISQETFIKKPFSDKIGGIEYPLKFSFNKDAIYEQLEAAKDCPKQGFL